MSTNPTPLSLWHWVNLSLHSAAVLNAHGPGRVDSVLYTQLWMLGLELVALIEAPEQHRRNVTLSQRPKAHTRSKDGAPPQKVP